MSKMFDISFLFSYYRSAFDREDSILWIMYIRDVWGYLIISENIDVYSFPSGNWSMILIVTF